MTRQEDTAFCMTLHDEMGGGFNPMMLALCFGASKPIFHKILQDDLEL